VARDVRIEPGSLLTLDSGANLEGYIGDVARVAHLSAPPPELAGALEELEAVQQAAFAAIRAGVPGAAIYDAAEPVLAACEHAAAMEFVAHGMGMVTHEAPRLAVGRWNLHDYPADHRDRPLEAGMVVSIETLIATPRLGYLKLEDTVAVTPTGHEVYGAGARGWNVIDA
jgi:Xaa-Pro aminopeptidase